MIRIMEPGGHQHSKEMTRTEPHQLGSRMLGVCNKRTDKNAIVCISTRGPSRQTGPKTLEIPSGTRYGSPWMPSPVHQGYETTTSRTSV